MKKHMKCRLLAAILIVTLLAGEMGLSDVFAEKDAGTEMTVSGSEEPVTPEAPESAESPEADTSPEATESPEADTVPEATESPDTEVSPEETESPDTEAGPEAIESPEDTEASPEATESPETAEEPGAADGVEIELLMRPVDEENSSDMAYYLEGSFDSYSWEIWTGEEWQEIGEYEAELVVGKEEWYAYRFRCIAEKDGVFYTAFAEDGWQTENMGIMLMAANAAGSGQSDYMYYTNSGAYFNVKGRDNGAAIQTTFVDGGYRTASAVNGGSKVNWNSAEEVAMGNSLYGAREISLVYNGRYAKIKYTVTNRGSSSQSFQVGSSADVMIGNNDSAPVVGSDSGLVMSGSPKNSYTFHLVAPTASTLWYGFYSQAYSNMFTNLADRSKEYKADSGMAWSWSGTVAPGQTWSRYVLLGVGELPASPSVPKLTNQNPRLEPGVPTVLSGTADPGNTVSIEVGGEEFTGTADSKGNFSVTVTPPQGLTEGRTDVNYYAVSADGGISDVGTVTGTVNIRPSITLTDATTTVTEDSALDDAWYRSFISSYNGTVSYNASSVRTGTLGTYTVTYTAAKTGYTSATAALRITVLPLPLELSAVTATRVSGKDSFTLSASLKHTGGEAISETGFVWGIMQNPTVSLNNGSKRTSSVIKTKGGGLSLTADGIVDGVTYYARAYVKTSGGSVYYSPQKSFSINGKSYGTFTITNNNNNTFTVTRTGGADGTQTVYFRTVNGSAIGGTHFTHQASTLTFAQGITSKTITVSEKGVTAVYNGKPATSYSNVDRTYQVEIYRVDGGGTLGTATRATRKMPKDSSYTVDPTIYDWQTVDGPQGEKERGDYDADKLGWTKNNSYAAAKEIISVKDNVLPGIRGYWTNTAQNLYYYITFDAKEYEAGYQALQIAPGTSLDVTAYPYQSSLDGSLYNAYYMLLFEHGGNGKQTTWGAHTIPRSSDYTDVRKNASHMEGNYVRFDVAEQNISIGYGACGSGSDKWATRNVVHHFKLKDIKEPQLLGVAPMAGGTYKEGEEVTISLVFDEIVDSANSTLSKVSLSTSWGTFNYAGGADTNVLFFTGKVPSGASGTLKINSITGAEYIKDMCSTAGTSYGGSGSVTVSVDTNAPSISITNAAIANKTAKATITATNADTIKYTWSQSSTTPVTGWVTGTNGQTVSTRQASGVWFLHVLATYNATGETAHKSASFDFSSSACGAMPELTLSADNSTWARSRTITLTKSPSNGTVTVRTPAGATSAVTGTSYTATANGSYMFTLKTSDGETVVKSITVSKIDRTAPKAVITGPAGLTQNEKVKLTVTPTDVGGSGVKTVTGKWTRTTNGGSESTVTATLIKNSDGTYSATTPGSAGNNYTYKLTVTVTDNAGNTVSAASAKYTVNLKAPTVTVRRTGSSTTGDSYSYTVASNGNTITAVQLPDGTVSTALSGTFTLTSPGTYYVTVSDEIGHVVRSSAMTVAAGVDGNAPEVRLYQQNENWTKGTVRLDVSIYEEGSIASAVWKKDGTASNKTLSYSAQEASVYSGTFSVTENGTYTVTVTDARGNTGTASITVSNIDATKPEVTCTINASANAVSGWYTSSSVPVLLSFADNTGAEGGNPSGIQTVQYKLVSDNKLKPTTGLSSLNTASASFRDGAYTYPISGNGVYYLYYKVTDHAGNVTDGFSDIIRKDSYGGSATVTGPSKGQPVSAGLDMHIKLWYGPGGGSLYGGAAKLAAMVNYSGMSVANKSVTADYNVTSAGTNYFRYYKNAFNTSSYWYFYVREVKFDSQGGSPVDSQLVWFRSSSSSALDCAVTEPASPTRTGYTFGGWYTDAACTDGNKFDFSTQVKENTTLYAKWMVNTYSVSYSLKNPDGSDYTVDNSHGSYTYGQGLELPVPKQEGYTFYGWYDNAQYTGTAYTQIGKEATGARTYYGYYKDVEAPVIAAALTNGAVEDGSMWYGTANRPAITLTYSDNAGVSEIAVQIDDGEYTPISGITTGNATQSTTTALYNLTEGEHTYTFRAVDEAGNETVTDAVTVKLDMEKPVIETITYEQKAAGFLDWIIGKESLIVHIPVKDSVSGVTKLTYTITTVTPEGNETTEDKTVSFSGEAKEQTAELTLDADWKGSITNITCTDNAGNVSDSKSIGGAGGGIIVEDNPPAITITEADMSDAGHPQPGNAVSSDYYTQDSVPTLYVAVGDEGVDSPEITAGIESITYTINGGTEHAVEGSFAQQLTGRRSFTIPLTGKAGVVNVTVKASDHAGNTASESVTVYIDGQQETPQAVPDYQKDALTGLVPGEVYEITVSGADGGSETVYTYTGNADGEIPLIDADGNDLCGKTISIVRKGDGTNTTDSDPQENIVIQARPEALDPDDSTQIKVTPEIVQGADDAEIEITIDLGAGNDGKDREYSTDGGQTWTDVPEDHIIKDLEPGDVVIREKADENVPHGEETTIHIPASAKTITAVFDLNCADAQNAPASKTDLKYTDPLQEPAVTPDRAGYDFMGWYKDAACQGEAWDFENNIGDVIDKEAKNYDEIDGVITVRLYAKWRENVAPGIHAVLADQKEAENWHQELSFVLTYSDNVGVTKLYVSRDGAEYEELNTGSVAEDGSDSDGNTQYRFVYADLEEGEHTYTFQAMDAAGNKTETTALTAKLDRSSPVLGEASFNEGYKTFWDWIIRNDQLVITIPISEAESEIDTVMYTLTPAGGQAGEAQEAEVVKASGDGSCDYTATIRIDPDFKGSISITARDTAGNASAAKTIGTDGEGIHGVIVEDNAPVITILADRGTGDHASTQPDGTEVSTSYYDTAPKLVVEVTDQDNGALTGGLASVSWKLDNGQEQPVRGAFQSSVQTTYGFTISELEGRTGTYTVTVQAEDQAGNTASETVTVHIKAREAVPAPSIDYQKEKLTGLDPNGSYEIGGETITADNSGSIEIKEEWFGNDIQIRRKGGQDTLDSENTEISIAARPANPSGITVTDETIKGKMDAVMTGVGATMEYSVDHGKTWLSVNDSDGDRITGLASGEVRIRIKAAAKTPHGASEVVNIREGRTLKADFVTNGGSSIASITGKSWHDTLSRPTDPVRAGYAFEGWYQEADCRTIWQFASDEPGDEADRLTGDVTLYAKWRDNEQPGLGAVLADGKDTRKWYSELSYALTYSDNVGVTELYVKRDSGDYEELAISGSGQSFTGLIEGEHTYTFKAVDAAGNVTETEALTAKLDETAPVIGELDWEYKAANLWNWVIGKTDLVITVPVTEEISGAGEISYTVKQEGGQSEAATASLKNGEAEITFEKNFKGTITITCTDAAGNTSDSVTVGADGGGVIAEDHAPGISFAVGNSEISENYYANAPDISVSVTDDRTEGDESIISGGIASVTYKVGRRSEKAVDHDYLSAMVTEDSFIIPAAELPAGETPITVMATDHAGNTAEGTVIVKVEGPEEKPEAVISYTDVALDELVPYGEYVINGEGRIADENGRIPIEDSWMDTTISIVKQGNGRGTMDSEPQSLTIPSRPAAPEGIGATDESYPDAGDGAVTGLSAGTDYEISYDGGSTWVDAGLSGTEITGLASGSYQVRVKATEGAFPSEVLSVAIGTTPAVPEIIPQAEISYTDELLTGLTPGGEYEVKYTTADGADHTEKRTADADGNIRVEEEWHGQTIKIVKPGNGKDKSDSDPQSLTLLERQDTPRPQAVGESNPGKKDGYIINLTPGTVYQISTDEGITWRDVTADENGRINGLESGSYEVRVKATDGMFCSESVQCKVETHPAGEDSASGNNGTGTGAETSGGTGTGTIIGTGSGTGTGTGGGAGTKNTGGTGTATAIGTGTGGNKTVSADAPEEEEAVTALYTVEDGKVIPRTGTEAEGLDKENKTAVLTVDQGRIVVTVNNVDDTLCTARITDAAAVANAVLSGQEIAQVSQGEVIEIRVDVERIDELVSQEDRQLTEQGIEASRKEIPDLTVGSYVDISMFMRIGEAEWSTVSETREPVEITIDIPEELQSLSAEFYIVRIHEGEYTLLEDLDDAPETITIRTSQFSTYAIAYRQTDTEAGAAKCGLCHICPTFLGICCFIWLAVIVAAVVLVMILLRLRRRRTDEEINDRL